MANSKYEKVFNLIFKKRFFQFLKYFYILLLICSFLGIASYHIIGLSEFFRLDSHIQSDLFYTAIEFSIFLLLTIIAGISLFFWRKKSKIFLTLYSLIPVYFMLLYFILDLCYHDVRWNKVFIYGLVIYIPSILLGWFYNFIMRLINQQIEKINVEIINAENQMLNGSQQ